MEVLAHKTRQLCYPDDRVIEVFLCSNCGRCVREEIKICRCGAVFQDKKEK